METNARYLLVGSFVLVSFIGILLFFLWLVGSDFEEGKDRYAIYFKGSVTGLSTGSPVRFSGVNVGLVKTIDIDPNDVSQVRVVASIDDKITIREDAVASLEMQGLTGYMFVQIYGGENSSAPLVAKPGQKYPVIQSKASSVEELMSSMPRLLGRLNNLVERATEVFNQENRQAFADVLHNMNELTGSLRKSAGPLHDLIIDARKQTREVGQEAHVLMKSLNATSTKIENFMTENEGALNTFTQNGLTEMMGTLSSLKEASSQMATLVEKINTENLPGILNPQEGGISLPQ